MPADRHSVKAARTADGKPAWPPSSVADESIQTRSGFATRSGQRSIVESRSARIRSMYVPGAPDMISTSVARTRVAARNDVVDNVPPRIPSRAEDGYVAQLTM